MSQNERQPENGQATFTAQNSRNSYKCHSMEDLKDCVLYDYRWKGEGEVTGEAWVCNEDGDKALIACYGCDPNDPESVLEYSFYSDESYGYKMTDAEAEMVIDAVKLLEPAA